MTRHYRWSVALILLFSCAVLGDPPKATPAKGDDPVGGRWRLRFSLLARIKAAPQLRYTVDKLTVYKDGVWADYSITNLHEKRLYLSPTHVAGPVQFVKGRDATGTAWHFPHTDAHVQYVDDDTFIAIGPDSRIQFRQKVTDLLRRPLEPVDPTPVGEIRARPAELSYVFAKWHHVYTLLSGDKQEEVYAFASGQGKVAVKWVDDMAPSTLPYQQRLYGNQD
jgi:hypothetical protein